ncbi:hypothetical protein RFI_06850 [Reticulomyxa filosa]|uniref:Uncharacterized protein n=1 Tax=Reticulomyxa filosa TaxID=46433 RepID=X6NWL0_RETFI|nr:hypothetical protein RFI_06850 [Reticulomyxa filosa]|eukprot:ETO30268.1 hypothetical protein RFI_06850 [Reticulomyxa filosa]
MDQRLAATRNPDTKKYCCKVKECSYTALSGYKFECHNVVEHMDIIADFMFEYLCLFFPFSSSSNFLYPFDFHLMISSLLCCSLTTMRLYAGAPVPPDELLFIRYYSVTIDFENGPSIISSDAPSKNSCKKSKTIDGKLKGCKEVKKNTEYIGSVSPNSKLKASTTLHRHFRIENRKFRGIFCTSRQPPARWKARICCNGTTHYGDNIYENSEQWMAALEHDWLQLKKKPSKILAQLNKAKSLHKKTKSLLNFPHGLPHQLLLILKQREEKLHTQRLTTPTDSPTASPTASPTSSVRQRENKTVVDIYYEYVELLRNICNIHVDDCNTHHV